MKRSTAIPVLKSRAKAQARKAGIPHTQALDDIAKAEGFSSWSMLSAADQPDIAFVPGDLVLLGARPGHGKTLLALRILADAAARGQIGFFFTLEYTSLQVLERLRHLGIDAAGLGDGFRLDTSDRICADHISGQTMAAPKGSYIAIDYLQLLDQRRSNPPLAMQVKALQSHAKSRDLVIIMISQIDRTYDEATAELPGLGDVRLPNPLDLSLFRKGCFLHDGQVNIIPAEPG